MEYSITIADVQLFPQGFAALMAEPDLLTDEPSLLLMDIGGWTVDLMRTDNALPVAETAHSLELGMIRCIDEIRETLADLFGTRAEHSGGGYDAYRVKDLDGKEWKIVRDGSIHPEGYLRSSTSGEYKVELNSPKLEYAEMEKLQEVVRALRRAGGKVNLSCGMHVHVDASKHTPQSLKNVLSIMYSKEDILFAALKVNPARIDSYCQAVDEPILEEIRKLPSGASMDQLKDRWYRGRDGSDYHYHQSRYHALNLHSVFYHGTVEWRLFNSTLHAGEAKANIILAMAISAQGINQKYTQFRKTPIGDNPAFTFRTFLLRLGVIGPEYKNVRMHLLKNLPGDKAWRHDKSLYPSNQPRPRTDEAR